MIGLGTYETGTHVHREDDGVEGMLILVTLVVTRASAEPLLIALELHLRKVRYIHQDWNYEHKYY